MRASTVKKYRFWIAAALLASLLVSSALMVFWLMRPNSRIVYDERSHHLPAIQAFSTQLPSPDLRNPKIATTPGYHLLMAIATRYFGFDVQGLRTLNLLIACGLATVIASGVSSRQSIASTVMLGLPVIFCVYVITSSAWLLPENAGWAMVTLILVLALRPASARSITVMSGTLLALVLVRQAHAWCAALIVAGALLDDRGEPDLRRGTLSLVAILPAALALGGFVILWHGLVPPMFQAERDYRLSTQYSGWAPAAPAFTMTLIGFYGIALLPWFVRSALTNQKPKRLLHFVLFGALIGLVVGVLPETSFHIPNRRSGLWRLAQIVPTFAHRAPLICLLSTVGGAIGAVVVASLERRDRYILLVAMLGFVVAQCVNPMVWQRYYEPWVLLWLLISASRVPPSTSRPIEIKLRYVGLISLTILQLAITIYTLRGAGE